MRIEVQWYSEKTHILHVVFHAKWSWSDFHEQREIAYKLLRQTPYDIAILMEWDEDAATSPTNSFTKLNQAVESSAANIGMVVLVSPSPIWRVIIQTLKRLLPNSVLKRTYFVKSREEALVLLEPFLNGEAVQG